MPTTPRSRKRAAVARAAPASPVSVKPGFGEVGVTGLSQSMGVIDEEVLRELKGERAIRTYKEMRTDPVIAGGLGAIELQVRQLEWPIDPASAEDQDKANAEHVESCLDDMSTSWTDTVCEILSMLVYGWSAHEIVYKQRLGRKANPGESSRFDDGLIGWRKLPIRSQDTRERWQFGDDGSVSALVQRDPRTYKQYIIPIEKMLLFRPRAFKGNPEGESVIRGAFLPWYYKSNVRRFQGIGAERALAGMPWARIPAKVIAEGGAPFDGWKRMVALVKENRHKSIVYPSDPWDGTNLLQYEFGLIKSEGKHNFDTVELIDSYNQEMGRALLVGFMGMGERTASGSWAAADVFSGLLSTVIAAWTDAIASVMNRHAIPRLFALNPSLRVGPAGYPRIAPSALDRVDFGEFAKAWAALSAGGFDFGPDDEAWFRRRTRMPARVAEVMT